MYIRVCVCASDTKQIPLEPVIVQKSHAVPMLTDTKQWVPPHCLSFALFLSHFHPVVSSSPLLFILSLPSPLLPLSSHFVFSWFSAWPHPWENNYQMGTPCFNSDLEVNNSITFTGLFCCETCQCSSSIHQWYCLRSNHCNLSLMEELARHPPCSVSWNIVSMQWC